jgi:cytidyltransferase-like protein
MNKIFNSVTAVRESIDATEKVILVAGCFDLLHVGHLSLLEYSKSLGGFVVACVLSDTFVSSYKGSSRPIIKHDDRARLVSGLSCVDRVYIDNKSPSTDSFTYSYIIFRILLSLPLYTECKLFIEINA